MSGYTRFGGFHSGFTLVGLIVALTIMATISSVAGFYYLQVIENQKLGICKNELATIATHVRSYMISRGYPEMEAHLEEQGCKQILVSNGIYTDALIGYYPLDFLVKGGLLNEVRLDPWNNPYVIDPAAGVVLSAGPNNDGTSLDGYLDDIRVPFTKTIDITSKETPVYMDDTVPPIITGCTPLGIVRINNPEVKALFEDHFGGSIDSESIKMWINGIDIETIPSSQCEITSGMNQIIYTTNGEFLPGDYTVVVQVQDGSGNVARREWTFKIDTSPSIVKIIKPDQGGLYAKKFDIQYKIIEDNCKRWWLDWDEVTIAGQSFLEPQNVTLVNSYTVDPIVTNIYPSDNKKLDLQLEYVLDGLHYITVKVEDGTGRIETDQIEVLMDNQAPVCTITEFPPNAQAANPMIIQTTLPEFKGWADDNMQIKKVAFWYRDSGGINYGGDALDPTTACPVDYHGTPHLDWMSYYNSNAEEWSTTGDAGAVAGGFNNTTVPMEKYTLTAVAWDLAGNKSAEATTEFRVDLLFGGIVGQKFVDASYSGQNVLFTPYRQITSRRGAGELPTPEDLMAQTTGIVSFMCKQKETDSVWQAVLDENKDGIYKAFTVVSAAFDWTSTGPNNLSTSTPRLSEEFYPYAVNNTIAHDSSLRRGNDLNMPEGKYFIECSYSSLLGLTRTALATMEIDNTKPVITDVTYRVGMTDIPLDGEIITEFTVGTGSGPGTDKKIHLSGRAYDGPPEFGVISAVYFKAYQKDDPGGYPGVPSAFYPDIAGGGITNRAWPVQTSGSPGWLSQPPKQDCIFGARFTDLDAGYSLDSNDFTLETTQSFGLDGDWRLWVCAQDGAGLTSFTYYDFTVNCVGPTTEWIRIDNAVTPYTVTPWDSSAGTAYIGERRLVTSFMVKDEVPLTNVKYMIYPKNTPMPPDGTNLPISLFPSHTEIGLVLVADSNGSEFQSAPVSYTLQVWGESAGPTGQKLEAFIEFEFLMSLAIVAPHYSAVDNGGAMWIGKDEQTAVATYLFNSITAVENKVVYDMSGTAVPGLSSGFGGSPPDLDAWLSNQTGTGTTDVLVILDQAQEDLITGDAFKHFYQDGTDGDAIVWMGNYPFSTYMKPDMTQGGTSGSGGFIDLLACGSTDDDCVSIYQYPVVNYQKISPVPGNGPGGNIYIPSLNDNNPNDFGSDSILRSAKVKSEGDSWGNSTLERTFTVRDDFAAGKRDSANFLTRHNSSNCRFASFFSYGKGSGGVNVSASPRSAEPPLDQASSNVIDTSPTDHRYVLNVIDDMLIEGITIYLNINGFDWEDYRIWLEGPNGVNVGGAIKMFNQQGDLESRDEHIDCTLPDEFPVNIDPGKNWAAFVDGDAALDQFVGTLSKGEWALHIYGDGGSVSGSILKWGLNLEGKNYIETDYSYPGTDKDQDNSSTLDDDPDTHYFEIVVPTAGIVTEVKVDLDYESDEIEDYRVWLARDSDNSGGSKLILKGVDVSADGGDDDSEWWYTHLRITATIPDDLGTITGVDVDGDSHTWSQLYDPEALSQFEGKQAAATWRLYIASPGYNADGNSIKKAYPWGLKLKIATAVTGALRDPVTPAPFVIREFIENYMLNKGNPDASAKTIFYSADKTHQGDATPADEADQWDIYSYPNSSAGWTNLTTPNGDNAYVLGCAASGSRVYFATKQYTNSSSSLGPSPAYDDYSLFAIEGGSVHNIFEADVSGGGIFLPGQDGGDEEWCRGNGVDVASDGTVVFSASVKASNPLASWPNRVIYVTPRGGLSGVMTQITTGFGPSGTGTGLGHVEAAMLPHISDNGNWLSFSSKTVYGQVPSLGIDCRPPFSGSSTVGTTATTQIWRYNYSEMGSGNEYLRGWISKDTFFENIVPVHVDDYLDCMLTNSGETAVFSVIPNGGNIINVGFAMLDSNALWKQGRITRSTVAGSFAGGPGKVAIHNKGAGLPEIIFLTNVVGLDGLSPHLNDGSSSPIFDSSLQKNTTHYCQGAGEGLPTGALRLVYLSTPNGSFTLKELIVFTGTTDRKMFGNLEWSKDGKEVVFTGKFDQPFELPNDSGGVTTVPAMNGVWAVFRMALGADTEESDLSVNCAFSHVMPDKAIDYTDEGQTGSQPMFLTGFIAR